VSFPGIQTGRDEFLIDIRRDNLVKRMETYFDLSVSHDAMRNVAAVAMHDSARFSAVATREYLQKRGFLPDRIVRHAYRPFDARWLYWEPETKLIDEKRAEYFPHAFPANIAFVASAQNRREFDPPIFTHLLCGRHVVERGANVFPLYLRATGQQSLFDVAVPNEPTGNLSDTARDYLSRIEANEQDLFYHTLAMLHAPAYREENAGALRQDWPRVPLPGSRDALLASAALGRQIAALLDTETDVSGVTKGSVRAGLAVDWTDSPYRGAATEAGSGRTGRDRRMGAWRQGRRDDAGPGQGDGTRVHATRTRGIRGRRDGTRYDAGRYARLSWRDDTRRVPERRRVLGEHPGEGLGVHHRRLSGDEEMAVVPGTRLTCYPKCVQAFCETSACQMAWA